MSLNEVNSNAKGFDVTTQTHCAKFKISVPTNLQKNQLFTQGPCIRASLSYFIKCEASV